MPLTCHFIPDSDSDPQILFCDEYNRKLHHKKIFDKFTGKPVFFKKGFERNQHGKKVPVRPHFFCQPIDLPFPDDLEFDNEYWRDDITYCNNESREHLFGKKHISHLISQYQHFDSQNRLIKFEHPVILPNKKRRIIDVALIEDFGDDIIEITAFECQLSSITTEVLEQRSRDYHALGINVQWFFGLSANNDRNLKWHLEFLHSYPHVLDFSEEVVTHKFSSDDYEK